MIQKEHDWVEESHREAMERQLEHEKQGHALVQQAHEVACKRHRDEEERVRQAMDEAPEQVNATPWESEESPTVHCTDLQELPKDSPIGKEWNTYRREVLRLIREGMEGRFALIKGETIVGIFDTFDEALEVGRQKYLMQPFLVQPIREREPLLRIRGHTLPCPSSATRSPSAR